MYLSREINLLAMEQNKKRASDPSLSHFGRPSLLVSYEIDTKAEKFLQGKWHCGEISSLKQDL